jgi:uncharacterized protein YkwD
MTTVALAPGPTYPGARGAVYLPIVAVAPLDPVDVFYDLLFHDSRQQRPRLTVCKALEAGASKRAWGLANGEPFLHTDSQGRHANGIARAFGCNLPATYSDDANYVESLCAGSADAQVMFDSLARSPHHSIHLFGLNSFFAEQHHVGIGMAYNPESAYGWYWVAWIARCGD